MIKQERIVVNDVTVGLIINTDEKTFSVSNTKVKSKKGGSTFQFSFYKSHDFQLCLDVLEAIKKAVERAEEIIKNENKAK